MRHLQVTIKTLKPITKFGKIELENFNQCYEDLVIGVEDGVKLSDVEKFIKSLDGFLDIHSFSHIHRENTTPDIYYKPVTNVSGEKL